MDFFTLFESDSTCTQDTSSTTTTQNGILFIEEPKHGFHGNHWFHFGEYYLSRRQKFSYLQSVTGTLFIVARNPLLLTMMTEFTFCLMVLAFWYPQIQTITLLQGKYSTKYYLSHHPVMQNQSIQVIAKPTIYSFSMKEPVHTRFIPFRDTHNHQRKLLETTLPVPYACYEGQYMGKVGSHPIPSDRWFQPVNTSHTHRNSNSNKLSSDSTTTTLLPATHPFIQQQIHTLRDRIATICTPPTSSPTPTTPNTSSKPRRVLIYQRDETRCIENLSYFYKRLHKALLTSSTVTPPTDPTKKKKTKSWKSLSWVIEIVHHRDTLSPCAVYDIFHRTDILITTHGFQLTAMMFLPAGSTVIEIFPYQYFKPSYFTYAKALSVEHYWFQVQPQSLLSEDESLEQKKKKRTWAEWLLTKVSLAHCMVDQRCRSYARKQDISLSEQDIDQLLALLLQIHYGLPSRFLSSSNTP